MRTKRLIVATFVTFFLQAISYAILVAADRPRALAASTTLSSPMAR